MGQLSYSSAQLNAMLTTLYGDNADSNFRVKDADTFQIVNVTDGKFHTEWAQTSSGKAKKKIAITGEA